MEVEQLMPWSKRGNKRYFYQSRRVDGRVTRKYCGTGPAADKAAAEIERRKNERAAQAKVLRAETQRHAAATAPLDELFELIDLLAGATLVSAGYHRHARGEWRHRRNVTGNDA